MNYNSVNILSLLLKIGIQFQRKCNCGRIESVGKLIKSKKSEIWNTGMEGIISKEP
jgi:hypothetical protein